MLLAKALGQGGNPVTTLRAWEAERMPRTAKIVKDSRRVGRLGQSEKPIPRFAHQVGARITSFMFSKGRGAEDLKVEY